MKKSKKFIAFVIFPLLFLSLVIFALVTGGMEISQGSRARHSVNPIGLLTVNTEFGKIHIETTDQDHIVIATTKKWKPQFGILQELKHSKGIHELFEDFEVTIEFDDPDVQSYIRVEGKFKRGWEYWQEVLKRKWLTIEVQVTVPRQYNVTLKTVSGGDIHVGDLIGTVSAEALGGNLYLGEIQGEVWGKTGVSGDITLKGCQSSVNLTTAMGNIQAEMTTQPQHPWTLHASMDGAIDVTLPSDIAIDVDVQTQGKILSDPSIQFHGDIKENKLNGTLNDGGPLLKLHSSTGDIRLKQQ